MDHDQPNAETRAVLDVLVHMMGARPPKIRLDKLKESENHAVMSVYPDVFWTSYDDESPQRKKREEMLFIGIQMEDQV